MKSSEEVKAFYDGYQFKLRHNIRHYIIINGLIDAGLKSNSKVLEIGCGNGALTKLMVARVKTGKITSLDISSESIMNAKNNLKNFSNIDFIVTDVSNFKSTEKFDAIVLSDVLEHIPLENHDDLFKNLSDLLNDDGFIYINIPEPKGIEWIAKHEPEKLQVIDQAVHSDTLVSICYKHGLYLTELKSYSIFKDHADYQTVIFEKRKRTFHYTSFSKMKIIMVKYWNYFKFKLR